MEDSLSVARELSRQTIPISKEALDKLASILVRTEIKKGQNFLNKTLTYRIEYSIHSIRK